MMKTVHDPIHGSISIEDFFVDIMDRPEMQRLHSVKQLGLGNIVFPGANHTRFEHCMGVYHLSGRMSSVMGLDRDDDLAVRSAGFLHDICHAPFSHTLESLLEEITKCNHMDLARELIFGRVPTFMERDKDLFDGLESISSLLEDNGVSPEQVCDLIAYPRSDMGALHSQDGDSYFSSKDYLHQIIHGPVDSDQMDYLLRDAHYTGVTHGTIDMDRLLSQMIRYNDKMVLRKGGIVAAEGLMVSRILMHSSVYFHRTVRMVELMMVKAVEEAMDQGEDMSELYLMTDSDLLSRLISCGGKASVLTRDLIYRRIYKKAYSIYHNSLSEDDVTELLKYQGNKGRRTLEDQIARRAGLDRSEIVVDIQPRHMLLSSLKIGKTDVLILDNGRVRSLASISPLARSLQSRAMFDWAVLVSAPKGKEEVVHKAAKSVIGIDDVSL